MPANKNNKPADSKTRNLRLKLAITIIAFLTACVTACITLFKNPAQVTNNDKGAAPSQKDQFEKTEVIEEVTTTHRTKKTTTKKLVKF